MFTRSYRNSAPAYAGEASGLTPAAVLPPPPARLEDDRSGGIPGMGAAQAVLRIPDGPNGCASCYAWIQSEDRNETVIAVRYAVAESTVVWLETRAAASVHVVRRSSLAAGYGRIVLAPVHVERRRAERRPEYCDGEIRWRKGLLRKVARASIRDISSGGAQVATHERLPAGATVELRFRDREHHGEVRWSNTAKDRSFLAGVRFERTASAAPATVVGARICIPARLSGIDELD